MKRRGPRIQGYPCEAHAPLAEMSAWRARGTVTHAGLPGGSGLDGRAALIDTYRRSRRVIWLCRSLRLCDRKSDTSQSFANWDMA